MTTLWDISARDRGRKTFFVFHTYEPRGNGVQFRPEYQRLVCSQCSWYDPKKAAKAGIHADVRSPFRDRDIVFSDDGRLVVSRKCRRVFESIPGAGFDFFDFPGDRQFFLAFARTTIRPPKDLPITKNSVLSWRTRRPFVAYGKCSKCGHFQDVAYNEEYLELKRPIALAAVILDRGEWYGYMEAYIASDEVAMRLKQARLEGLWLRKIASEVGKAPEKAKPKSPKTKQRK